MNQRHYYRIDFYSEKWEGDLPQYNPDYNMPDSLHHRALAMINS